MTPVLMPRIDGPWWTVAGDPDLGGLTSPDQQPVDFAVWQAVDGTWQLWSCIRNTLCGGKTRLFHRWEGRPLPHLHPARRRPGGHRARGRLLHRLSPAQPQRHPDRQAEMGASQSVV